ncbi:MAG TPA: bifunctional precorrin-2 dehydrogenase/sirohydrochlorin ferrochelatase [Spirochaetota bacterium]|nr:bifunctional precorrin-2 dehydrogenase/sirohydrochlorin ferrochelatase [Spirochaetota bacterium]HPI23112.1 bifunctional precorrin-2 dehydrogenase/sirohydrochlorin ferrochelatase [Spirochaetota bacterium]HPU87136.1 bifunctional precorrin-2 dehydrogenase/sirohydrochlorin ferrochelatase [Spirochaetota bacterium]
MKPYPAFLNLEGRSVVIVGGGGVALRKVKDLLDAGARITLVAPSVLPEIAAIAAAEPARVAIRERAYEPGDCAGAALVISATDDGEVNRAVFREAEERNLFINAVDDPENCSFIVPSTIRRGDLLIAVSTGGLSPSMAARLRRELERHVPEDIEVKLEALAAARKALRENPRLSHLTSAERGEVLKYIANNDEVLNKLITATIAGEVVELLLTIVGR